MIPAALIDRVDVLTGGASAVYGSDALTGVVNFILKQNFQGLQIDEESSVSQDGGGNKQVRTADGRSVNSLGQVPIQFPGNVWDGWRQTVTITGGINAPDDKGNFEFYLGYTYIEAVDEGQRDYTKCSIATDNTSTSFQYCGGSYTSIAGSLEPLSGPNKGGIYNATGTPVGGMLPLFGQGDTFNYAPYNYLQRPDQRYTAGEFAHYEIAPWLTAYSSFMFMDDHSVADVAASGSFFGDNTYTIPCADPLLNAAQANTLCGAGPYTPGETALATLGRRNVEGGPRVADLEHMDYQMTFGGKGDLGNGWNYDLSGVYGRAVLTEIQSGYFLNSKLKNALDVVEGPSGPECESVVDGSDTSCVPYNVWTPGGVTQAALNYLSGTGINSGSVTQTAVTLDFTNADIGLKSPWASSGVGVSVGADYRDDQLATQFDAAIQGGDLAGFGGSAKDTSGSQIAEEIYGEARAPLVQDMAWAKDLTLDVGGRFSDYSHGGGNTTYKVGLEWQITSDFKLRGSIERAARAPNVDELFTPLAPGLFGGSDPCAGTAPTLTAAQCYNTIKATVPGMSEATFASTVYGTIPKCISAQCAGNFGGNPNLKPEIGNTYSGGIQFTPTFLRGFSATIDYWSIKIDKAIISLPGELLLTNCATLGSAFDCDNILRNPALNYAVYGNNGGGYVNLQDVNASALKTDGVDVNANYRLPLDDWHISGYGSVNLNFMGTYIRDLITTLPDGTAYNCVGLYGVTCGTPSPHWRHQFRVTWSTPWKVDVSVNWRYISAGSLDFNTSQPDLQNGYKDLTATDAHIPSFNYFDLSATWRVRDGLTMRLGVNNIFDKNPPLLDSNSFGISAPPFGNGNTYPQVYDPLGRVIFMGLTASF
jgi:iron complex outermembrane receptor protein